MPRVPVEVPGDDAAAVVVDDTPPDVGQSFYDDSEMKRLTEDSLYLLNYRKRIEFAINTGFAIFYKNTEASRMSEMYMRAEIVRKLNNHPVLSKKSVPECSVSCRRLTPGDGYLQSLIQENVECLFGGISRVNSLGFEMTDGSSHEVDTIIRATG
ncbi:hypothetical protein ACHAQH_006281 [Verticillium albo-atrum]